MSLIHHQQDYVQISCELWQIKFQKLVHQLAICIMPSIFTINKGDELYTKVGENKLPSESFGPKCPKYQALQHPDTNQNIEDKDIHANHVEAFNSTLRRRVAAYRRKTNTYAKNNLFLQKRLDAYWVLHNFVRPHFTIQQVPAIALSQKSFTLD